MGDVVDETSNSAFGLARFAGDGTADGAFGTGGLVETQIGTNAYARALVVTPEGAIFVGGQSCQLGGCAFTVARYGAGGALTPAFAHGGISTPAVGRFGGIAAMALQDTRHLIVAGGAEDVQGTSGFGLARYAFDP